MHPLKSFCQSLYEYETFMKQCCHYKALIPYIIHSFFVFLVVFHYSLYKSSLRTIKTMEQRFPEPDRIPDFLSQWQISHSKVEAFLSSVALIIPSVDPIQYGQILRYGKDEPSQRKSNFSCSSHRDSKWVAWSMVL